VAKNKSYILRHIPHKEIINKMLSSMTKVLDKHSKYSPEKNAKNEKENRTGFGGIGVRYRKTGNNLEITEVVTNSPAHKAEIYKGDSILKINNVDISLLNRKEIIKAIRGRSGTTVSLTLKTIKNEIKNITLIRRHIIEQTAKARLIDNVLYIEITSFNQQTTQEIRRIIKKFDDYKGIIIDLRDNPGGLLKQAVKTAELFIDNGIIVSTKGRHEDSVQFYNAKSGDISNGKPIIILIDGRTASSAEILAASLLDQSRAITIGTSTYGKGTVQTIISLFNKGELSITWSEFYTPAGYNLNNLGVMPILCSDSKIYEYINKDPRLAIKHINDINKNISSEIKNWSNMTNGDIKAKNKLREICHAKSRYKNEKDLDLALYILKNKTIYNRLKDIVASSN
jgi:carboxyl-terminal processing protease